MSKIVPYQESKVANSIRPALQAHELIRGSPLWCKVHAAAYAAEALQYRNAHLPYFLGAASAENQFRRAMDDNYADEARTAVIIADMHRDLATKISERDGLVEGTVKVLMHNNQVAKFLNQSNEIIYPTPEVIAFTAFRQRQTAKFAPKPAEFLEACRQVSRKIKAAHKCCDEWLRGFTQADAAALEFMPDAWEAPYRLPQYRPAVIEVLNRHVDACWGDKDRTYADSGVLAQRIEAACARFGMTDDDDEMLIAEAENPALLANDDDGETGEDQ